MLVQHQCGSHRTPGKSELSQTCPSHRIQQMLAVSWEWSHILQSLSLNLQTPPNRSETCYQSTMSGLGATCNRHHLKTSKRSWHHRECWLSTDHKPKQKCLQTHHPLAWVLSLCRDTWSGVQSHTFPQNLSETEQRYAQVEKEALAVTWACERLSTYLIGLSFMIETDHKRTKALDDLPPRVQRFRLRLLRFAYIHNLRAREVTNHS